MPRWKQPRKTRCHVLTARIAHCAFSPRNNAKERRKMVLRKKITIAAVFVLISAVAGRGQTKLPSETKNAALRYWLAFADLQDLPTDKATGELLEKTAAGEAPWDEAKLG